MNAIYWLSDKDMQMERSSIGLFTLLAIVALLSAIAMAMPAYAQHASGAGANDNLTAMPVSFVLDNIMDAQVQDIEENIFDYKLQAAKDSPDVQADLIKKRSDELRNDTNNKKKLLRMLLVNNSTMPASQRAGMAQQTNASLEMYDAWSKHLAEQAAGLTMLNDSGAYMQSVMPLIDNISDAQNMAAQISQETKDKNNKDNKGKNSPPDSK